VVFPAVVFSALLEVSAHLPSFLLPWQADVAFVFLLVPLLSSRPKIIEFKTFLQFAHFIATMIPKLTWRTTIGTNLFIGERQPVDTRHCRSLTEKFIEKICSSWLIVFLFL
jgi:hypothetical protein